MKKTYIISEIGLNHNGSVDLAKKMIDASKESGADAVKFQKRNVDTLATDEVLNAEDSRFPEFGKTYGDIRRHLEFNMDEYLEHEKYLDKLYIPQPPKIRCSKKFQTQGKPILCKNKNSL